MSSGDARVSRWINPVIRAMQAYPVADAADLIKLDAMENPYTCPQDLHDDWLRTLGTAAAINRYPDPAATAIKQALRDVMQVPDDKDLLVGNGSDEILQMIITALTGPDRTVLTPEPGFVMYRLLTQTLGLNYCAVSLHADFSLDMAAMCKAIEKEQPAVVFLASPNNPTGNRFQRDDIVRILETAPGLVVVDEAYSIFAGDGCMDLLGQYEHLLVMRTLSKLGLAGLRIGFLAGAPCWLQELEKVRLPYNINALSQISAAFFLKHYGVLQAQAECIIRDRDALFQALQDLPGLTVYPSKANFLLFRSQTMPADTIHQGLKTQGLLIKNLHGSHPLLDQCLRVTVGKPEENTAFLKALAAVLSG